MLWCQTAVYKIIEVDYNWYQPCVTSVTVHCFRPTDCVINVTEWILTWQSILTVGNWRKKQITIQMTGRWELLVKNCCYSVVSSIFMMNINFCGFCCNGIIQRSQDYLLKVLFIKNFVNSLFILKTMNFN